MILIKSAQVVDGTGKPPYKADVLIKDDKISAIGNYATKKAEVIVDGLGYYVTPGFIDVNTDADHYLALFTNPSQSDFIKQGVTTTIGGQCGSSLAPLLYGSLESIQKWTDIRQINVDWHTMKEFLKTLEKTKIGVNFGTLIGHSTIRRALIGEELRDLTESELKVFEHIIEKAMEEGALGFSTGLGYVHSRIASYQEILQLIKIVAKHGGVYATHLRNEEDKIVGSVKEAIRLTKETDVKTLISHFRPLKGFEKNYEEALEIIQKETDKLNFNFDGYPFDASVVPIYTLLPKWAQNGGLHDMLENLRSQEIQKRLLQEFSHINGDDIIVAQAPTAQYLVGKTLGAFARNQELELSPALIKLMLLTGLQATVIYKNINLGLAIKSLMSDKALVASNSAGLPERNDIIKHERFYNTFPKFLEIAGAANWPIEQTIKKFTSVPAQKFDIKKRGLLKESYQADLTMIRDNKISDVFVNGKQAMKNGKIQDVLAGRVIKKNSA